MDTYREEAREIPIAGNFDIIVAGGGCAGWAAATAASRQGASVLIIERFPFFGGTATAGLMANINAFRNQVPPDSLVTSRGLAEELIKTLAAADGLGPSAYEQRDYDLEAGELSYSYGVDPERMKWAMLKIANDAGVSMLFHTVVADVIAADSTVKGLIVENKSGRQAYLAKSVVDATGDADVAYWAGAPLLKESGTEDKALDAQLMYRVTGTARPTAQTILKGLGWDPNWAPVRNSVTVWGPSAGNLDGTDAEALSRAEVDVRLQVLHHFQELQAQNPALEAAELTATALRLGVRQTRFIEGEYVLTGEDALAGSQFDDVIALCSSPIIRYYGYRRFLEHEGFDIPYRCLIPKGVEGLIAAGRCISADQPAYEAFRAMAPIMSIGEAAGVAAALAAETDCPPRQVSAPALQQRLKEQGAELGQSRTKP